MQHLAYLDMDEEGSPLKIKGLKDQKKLLQIQKALQDGKLAIQTVAIKPSLLF